MAGDIATAARREHLESEIAGFRAEDADKSLQRRGAQRIRRGIAHRLRGWQFRRPSCRHGRDGPAAGRWRDVD